MFWTLQDRLQKELTLAGKCDVESANRFIRDVYLPAHNARFARPPQIAESAFVVADPALLAEILCIEQERIVARDNTLTYASRQLQSLATLVKARVKVREYPDGTLAVFHGPRRIARYSAQGTCPDRGQLDAVLAAVKARPGEGGARGERAATADLDKQLRAASRRWRDRDEETAPGSNKETDKRRSASTCSGLGLTIPRVVHRFRSGPHLRIPPRAVGQPTELARRGG